MIGVQPNSLTVTLIIYARPLFCRENLVCVVAPAGFWPLPEEATQVN